MGDTQEGATLAALGRELMLGRTESLEQLYLQKFKPKKIYCDKKSKEETKRITTDAKKALKENEWFSSQNVLKVSALNIRSLINKTEDLKKDDCLLQSDIIVVTETHYDHGFKRTKLNGYEDFSVINGKGKGKQNEYSYIIFDRLFYMNVISQSVIQQVSQFL